jgi:hypothetical protein
MRKKICVISFTALDKDVRVNRQIKLLSKYFSVTAVGTSDPNIESVVFLNYRRFKNSFLSQLIFSIYLLFRFYEKYYWSRYQIKECKKKLSKHQFDFILANDINSLPLALNISNGANVIFDAHEYAPLEFEEKLIWRIFFKSYNEYLCKRYIPQTHKMMTVCMSIAEEYYRNYGVKPVVVNNAPYFQDIKPQSPDGKSIRLVHHGGAVKSRNLEKIIETMNYLDERFFLDLYLMPSDLAYLNHLKKISGNQPKIQILPPVAISNIVTTINNYDIGIYLLEPNNFNNRCSLPNKFFDFIQARLAIAIGPSPEMKRLVDQYDCGIVSDDFSPKALADKLNRLDKQAIDYFKQQSHIAANALCFENNSKKILSLIDETLN